jgi:hypothetical protein
MMMLYSALLIVHSACVEYSRGIMENVSEASNVPPTRSHQQLATGDSESALDAKAGTGSWLREQ